MSTEQTKIYEQNKTIVRRYWEEVWNKGNLVVVDELVASDFDGHPLPSDPDFGRGSAGQKQLVGMYRTAFPDVRMAIEDMTAEGDRVVLRWTARGTNTGEMMGMPATGKPVRVTGIIINRLAAGKMVEGWGNFDALGMMQQLGVIPTPEHVRV
jgi:steroid delta-isomerase-like uncharacterized protein